MTAGHTHVSESGLVVRCYHHCRALLLRTSFWLGLTIGFPFEHLLWEKLWPFKLLTAWWGL